MSNALIGPLPGTDPVAYEAVVARTARDATEIDALVPAAIEEDRKRIAASAAYRLSGSASREGAIARARASFARGVARMVETGNHLLTCKDTCLHGEFMPFLKKAENWPYGYRWAAYCMEAARDFEHLSLEEQDVFLRTSFADRKKQIAERRKEEKRARAEEEAEDAEFTVEAPAAHKPSEVEKCTMVHPASAPAPTFNPIEPSCAALPGPAAPASPAPSPPVDLAALTSALVKSPLDTDIFRSLAIASPATLRVSEIERRPEHYALLLLRDTYKHLSDSSRRLRGSSRSAALSAWADRVAELLDVIEPVAKTRA